MQSEKRTKKDSSHFSENMIKFFRYFTILMLLGLSFATSGMSAQTFRVNIGGSTPGCSNYIEVYEYDFVTEKPSFPGGDSELMKFINNNREYPKEAYEKGIQGRVTCSFVIDTDGSVCHISVLRGVEPSLNREAIRVLSQMPEWQPGKMNGRVVPTRVVRSVPFRK